MAIHFEIKQRVDTCNKAWLETVYRTESERVAKLSFDEIQRDNPDSYFELIKITHEEQCLKFTETA